MVAKIPRAKPIVSEIQSQKILSKSTQKRSKYAAEMKKKEAKRIATDVATLDSKCYCNIQKAVPENQPIPTRIVSK